MQADTTAISDTEALAFITRWAGTTASELATAQSFVIDLCTLLGVERPHPTPAQDYMFERPVTFSHGDGSSSAGRVDCYKRGHFVLEAKKQKAQSHTKGFDDGLMRARAQGEGYARALPAGEGRPPFVLVVDVGTVLEVYAEFSQSGATYTPFPDPRSHRIKLADLARPEVRARLHKIWTDPASLNPALISAQVTRDVAALLAQLATSLEGGKNESNVPPAPAEHARAAPEIVAAYLTRCLFCMFAEDVELLPKGSFQGLLQTHRADPATLQIMLRSLWADMDSGGFSIALAKKLLRFNGKLFKGSTSDGYSLLLTTTQIDLLIQAAQTNWREVEPAIFGTLLERALDPVERHAMGAHFTPRAYVERLVLPTVIEPLRAEWADVQAAALVLAHEASTLEANPVAVASKADFAAADRHAAAVRAKWREARQVVKDFHHRLCTVVVLDPACGSGNFLYVTLEHLKRLEGEVLNQLADLGQAGAQDSLGFEGETVTLQQLRGLEVNERAAALAELVLWIGYLQWHIRTQGNAAVAEPVVHDYGNIEHRDAVLAWDSQQPAYGADGKLLTRWDGVTFKLHPVTGAKVPDEAAQVVQWSYIGARQAVWPQADFLVGNPPFIGAKYLRSALGDGYAEALRAAWPEVPESADFVMYWWSHAAALVAHGQALRFGLITTNSVIQTFNRRVVQAALDGAAGVHGSPAAVAGSGARTAAALILPNAQKSDGGSPHPSAGGVSLVFAIADHPWVDSANGAAVRIAMTVGAAGSQTSGRLLTVTSEQTGDFGEVAVTLTERLGVIHADLSVGANVSMAVALAANCNVSSPGVKLHGAGFIVTPNEAAALGLGNTPGLERIIRQYRNGRDLTDAPRGVMVIDAFGLTAEQLRAQYPAVYQWLLERVRPEREAKGTSKDGAGYAKLWWVHGKPRQEMRKQLTILPRYIATVVTAKHRVFQFLDAAILADDALICVASADAFHLGVLSSGLHAQWALVTGSTLEDRPRYTKTTCFDTFPFPDESTGLTPELRQKIASLAEQIDAHRKKVLGQSGADGSDLARAARMRPQPSPAAPAPSATSTPASKALTLTGLYNVLEALREQRPLTAKEKQIHTQGLVGVLKELHDELDCAVLQAYGLPNHASTDDILTHLVALNAERATQEAAGTVRWLRPAFQDPLSNKELLTHIPQGLQADLALNSASKSAASTVTTSATPIHWPSTLPEQVRAVAHVLTNATSALTLADLEARFTGKGAWKKSLPTLLQTLEALGRAQRVGNAWRQ
jgi:hypothetical protein